MLKSCVITITEPICGCSNQDITWSVPTIEGGSGLSLKCVTCKTELRVPNKEFKALVVFENAYPDDRPKVREGTGAPTVLDAMVAVS